MKKIILNLREQPVAVRKHILHVTTFVFAVILFFLWVFTLTTSTAVKEESVETSKAEGDNPISVMGASISNGYESLGE